MIQILINHQIHQLIFLKTMESFHFNYSEGGLDGGYWLNFLTSIFLFQPFFQPISSNSIQRVPYFGENVWIKLTKVCADLSTIG